MESTSVCPSRIGSDASTLRLILLAASGVRHAASSLVANINREREWNREISCLSSRLRDELFRSLLRMRACNEAGLGDRRRARAVNPSFARQMQGLVPIAIQQRDESSATFASITCELHAFEMLSGLG